MFGPEISVATAIASVGGLFAVILGLPVLSFYFERRLVWPYGEIDEEDPGAPATTPYHAREGDHAHTLGFCWSGSYRDLKGRLYRVRYDFWLASEGDALAMVGAGSLAAIPVEAVWIYTILADGRVVVSTNSLMAMEPMPGDRWEWGLRLDSELPKLLEWHRDRVAAMFTRVDPFNAEPTRAVSSLARLRAERVAAFVERCLARYRDANETVWSFTVAGAIRLTLRSYAKRMTAAVL